jgi:hypothetical protein
MNTIARVMLVAVLALGSGCAKSDWIQQTLVTVDVTGVWIGSTVRGDREVQLALEQQGPKVHGFFRPLGPALAVFPWSEGPIEGTVAGDVFSFRLTNANASGEVTVSGDEMKGYVSMGSPLPISLRRISSSAPPRSQ